MAKKYNYTITRIISSSSEVEAITVEGCDSLDEAVAAVKKALYELDLSRISPSKPAGPVIPIEEKIKVPGPNPEIKPEDIPL